MAIDDLYMQAVEDLYMELGRAPFPAEIEMYVQGLIHLQLMKRLKETG